MAKRKHTISFFGWLCCNATFSFFSSTCLFVLFCFLFFGLPAVFFRTQSNHFTLKYDLFQIPRGCCQTIFVVSLKTKDSLECPLSISQLASRFALGLQAWTYRGYEFVDDEIEIDEVQKRCARRRKHGSTINDMESLQNAINALKQNPNNDSYWTGLRLEDW